MDTISIFYVDFDKAWKQYQKQNEPKLGVTMASNMYVGGENSYCLTLPAYTKHTWQVVRSNMRNYLRHYYIMRYGYWD